MGPTSSSGDFNPPPHGYTVHSTATIVYEIWYKGQVAPEEKSGEVNKEVFYGAVHAFDFAIRDEKG